MEIRYQINPGPSLTPEMVLTLFEEAGILKPNWSVERMSRALSGSSLVVCAWYNAQLVGFARTISDFAWIAYLSHLAVKPSFQNKGIGKCLIERTLRETGDEVSLLVHSADSANKFYQSAGFETYSNVHIIKRTK
jgi:ribosomal protein S18 acetylase RimI-like enzyme